MQITPTILKESIHYYYVLLSILLLEQVHMLKGPLLACRDDISAYNSREIYCLILCLLGNQFVYSVPTYKKEPSSMYHLQLF